MATVASPRTSSEGDWRARLVAKIRGLKDQESASASAMPWFSVHKPHEDASQTVTIAFGDESQPSSRRECCVADSCYLSDQGSHIIFSREVEPLISTLFDARNVTIIACGARASGKTYLFQGTDDAPGLAPLAMAQVLSLAEQRSMLVAMSLYEIDQDHVFDLLNPQRHKISLCKDAKGNIQLKGLSRVRVTSVPEFLELYCGEQSSCKTTPKIANQLHRRTHKGLIVHVSSRGQKLDIPVGKMNFVDLAGYDDVRRKNGAEVNLIENSMINKSIYALHNVIYSLNTNEAHIPYRESKLTYMLEESLGGRSKILMITCLNPFFCQDSIYMMSLASRSCRGNDRIFSNTTKKTGSSARSVLPISHRSRISGSVSNKTKTMSRVFLSNKKPYCTHSGLEARKLFDEKSGLQIEKVQASAADVDISLLEEEASSICDPKTETKMSFTVSIHDTHEISLAVPNAQETIKSYQGLHSEDNCEEVEQQDSVTSVVRNDNKEENENNNSLVNENGSPPISARLQELSNNLKLLLRSSTPECCTSNGQTSTDLLEPRTPNENMTMNDREISSIRSPWKAFSISSSTVKDTLVKEYLRFLNTGTKEELKKLKGIGEKRATYILKLRETSPKCFKDLDDLKDVGLSAKQIKGMINKEVEGLFD